LTHAPRLFPPRTDAGCCSGWAVVRNCGPQPLGSSGSNRGVVSRHSLSRRTPSCSDYGHYERSGAGTHRGRRTSYNSAARPSHPGVDRSWSGCQPGRPGWTSAPVCLFTRRNNARAIERYAPADSWFCQSDNHYFSAGTNQVCALMAGRRRATAPSDGRPGPEASMDPGRFLIPQPVRTAGSHGPRCSRPFSAGQASCSGHQCDTP
jgi:hypothetical protein